MLINITIHQVEFVQELEEAKIHLLWVHIVAQLSLSCMLIFTLVQMANLKKKLVPL